MATKRKDFTQTALDLVQRATGAVPEASRTLPSKNATPEKSAPPPSLAGALKRKPKT